MDADENQTLLQTPLFDLHEELGAKIVPFAGYEMPVQYAAGIMKEHEHTRMKAGLFDVSHMGQAVLRGDSHEAVCEALETLVPGDLKSLKPGQMRYTLLLNENGGILDDLIVTRSAQEDGVLFLVVNAATKGDDFAYIQERVNLPLAILSDRALIALQGPKAAQVMDSLCPEACALTFMTSGFYEVNGIPCMVTRSGYTGEDGFEISIPDVQAEALASDLLRYEEVMPIGLGARDSLRLEAGLPLYGHDIGADTTPAEAGLSFAIGKRRRLEGGFPGESIILDQLDNGISRLRVGILPDGRAPAREGTEVSDKDGKPIGGITSGGFGPSVGGPIAMGYVLSQNAFIGTEINLHIRGKMQGAKIVKLPFVQHNYYRG